MLNYRIEYRRQGIGSRKNHCGSGRACACSDVFSWQPFRPLLRALLAEKTMLPLFLDLTNRQVLVVGAGPVGCRRAAAARAAGATVRLVSLEPAPADRDPLLDWRTEPYDSDHLEGIVLAFAAGPAEVNARVVADAQARGIWVNSASGPGGDVLFPALVRSGGLTLAISTGGAVPALARTVRARLESEFDNAFAVWLDLLAELRPLVRQRHAEEAMGALMPLELAGSSPGGGKRGRPQGVADRSRRRVSSQRLPVGFADP
jgi:precorrin-2 dehydrogenase/sirohydrochlorin ferrochelatase